MLMLALLLLVATPEPRIEGGVVLDYAGKYKDDTRLRRILKELPAMRAAALATIARVLGQDVTGEFLVRIADAGRDRSGRWAEVRTERVGKKSQPVLVLYTEYLVLDTHDRQKTLVHELYHCLQRARLGEERHLASPKWVREGAALYVAGQADERARILAATIGANARIPDPLARLVDGLGGRHTLEDYAEDVSAFLSVEARHGRRKAVALLHAFLRDPEGAVKGVLGETASVFERHAKDHARRTLAPLVEEGRESILAAQAKLAGKDYAGALERLQPAGVYAATARYYRALALHRLERHAEALAAVRDTAIHRTTLVGNAVLLELRILRALGHREFAETARRARLDLEPLRVYPELLKFLDD